MLKVIKVNEEVLNERRRRLLKKMLLAGVSLPVILKLLPELMADPKVASDEWDLDSVKLYLDKTNLPNTYIWEDGTDPVLNFDTGDQLLYDISADQFLFKIGGATELSLSATELKLDGVDLNVNDHELKDVKAVDGGGSPIVFHDHIMLGVDGSEGENLYIYSTTAGNFALFGYHTFNFYGNVSAYVQQMGTGNIIFRTKNTSGVITNRIVVNYGDIPDIDILNAKLDLNNNDINDVASIDGGGDAVVFNDAIDMDQNSIGNVKILYGKGNDSYLSFFAGSGGYNSRIYFYGYDYPTIGGEMRFEAANKNLASAIIRFRTANSTPALENRILINQGDNPDIDILNAKLDMNDNLIKDPTFVRVGVSANHTTSGETFIGCDSSGGSFTITLATADCIAGRVIIIKDEVGSANAHPITIATEGTEN